MSRTIGTLLNAAGQAVAVIDAQLSEAISSAAQGSKDGTKAAVGAPSSVVAGKVHATVDDAVLGHALNLDFALRVCDLVNEKQNSYPREVAFAILKHVNSKHDSIAALTAVGMLDQDRHRPPSFRYETIALNALGLLDMCVKNCGYPFHLIIASKEFLNELVKRFPEKPSVGNTIQFKILELIQQWNSTLCVTSRYREDFKNISDMYRLLSYKGYRFSGVATDSAAVLTAPNKMLKSEEEMEEEDRVAQGAKLQELLRLGTPAALEQANELMKVLSGYETEKKPNYKQAVESEIDRIEAKATALNNLFEESQPSSREIDELLGATKSAQSRIQSLISNGEQEERMDRLLQINDYINTTLENYQKFRSGQSFSKPSLPSHQTAAASSPSSVSPTHGAISLIDFDDSTIPAASPFSSVNFQVPSVTAVSASAASGAGGSSAANDLSDLDFFGGGSSSNNRSVRQPGPALGIAGTSAAGFGDLLGGGGGVGGNGGSSGNSFGGGLGSIPVMGIPVMGPALVNPNATAAQKSLGATSPAFGAPIISNVSIGSVNSRNASPLPPALNSTNLLNSNLDFSKMSTPANTPINPVSSASFSGPASLVAPLQNLQIASEPKDVRIFNKNGLQIKFKYQLDHASRTLQGQAIFMNTTPVAFEQLTFQVAVPKIMTLTLQPLSGTTVPALNQSQVTQTMSIVNPSTEPLKLRFKISYDLNGALVEESGEHVFQ